MFRYHDAISSELIQYIYLYVDIDISSQNVSCEKVSISRPFRSHCFLLYSISINSVYVYSYTVHLCTSVVIAQLKPNSYKFDNEGTIRNEHAINNKNHKY